GNGPYGVGISPSVREPDNAAANASLAHDPALRGKVTLGDGLSASPAARVPASRLPVEAGRPVLAADGRPATARKITSADVLEALHRATGIPIVSDFYTRLYPPEAASVQGERLFDALNHLADAMRLRWHKDASTRDARDAAVWLQFRSAS